MLLNQKRMKAQSIKEKKRKIKPKITEKDVSKCRRTHLTAFPLLYQASEKKIVKKSSLTPASQYLLSLVSRAFQVKINLHFMRLVGRFRAEA